jgi:hypothetical protein
MIKTNSSAILATFLSIIILHISLVGCSGNPSVDQFEQAITPATETAQAARAIALATQSSEIVKATFSANYADVIATEEALKNYYAERTNWPLIMRDTFDDNRNEWPIEDDNDDLASVSWKIENGKYLWDAMAKQAFIYWTYPSVTPVTDFSLSIDGQQIEGSQDGQYGLVLRLLDEYNYYLFMIDQDKNYSFQLYNDGEWSTITYGTISPAVLQDAGNRITVIGEGNNFRFYINDTFFSEETDYTLTSGKYGIAVGLTYPEDQALFEFDNFELRSPDEAGNFE